MKKKIILFAALTLLMAVILFMAWDMFFNKPADKGNPYAYDLKAFKSGDSSKIMYAEVQHFSPGLPAIHGIACDQSDRIFICGDNGVEIYDHAGNRKNGFTVNGTANCIQVDPDGRIYLGMQEHVEIFDNTGKQLKKWKTCDKDAIITSIAIAGKDVFIADAGNKVVCHYDQDGNLVKRIGEKDPARNIPGFVVPSPYFDLGTDGNGSLWVVNPGRHRIEKYNHDGDLTFTWGESSMAMEGFCGCCNPSNFAMLSDGSFVTSEKGIERIKVYGMRGDFRYMVAGSDAFVEGTRGLDIAVDSKDRILVLDPEKKQVRIFTLKKP
ncbi:MAG: NHL repeat-containing protein [Bacteroidetes bacterium]|nr:NHL repeat-containing protein [Bacteroidota bacterium]